MDLILLLIGILVAALAQIYISVTYAKYKKINNKKKLSGFDVARTILDEHGLNDVYVTEIRNNLSDHYDSTRKVVRLSTAVFHGTSIASVAVAAHEASHAIQDKENYTFMKIRNLIIPMVNFSSYAGYFAILIGILFANLTLIWVGIILEIIILLFNLVTLPVEFDASKKASNEIRKNAFLNKKESEGMNNVLKAAAFTYVAGTITIIMQTLRLILIAGNMKKK